MNFIIILVLFITANMAIVYSRDQLLSFRPSSALLNHHSRLTVSQLGLRRRGYRSGAHWRRRILAARGMTSQCNITRTCVGIPTINGHHIVVINNEHVNAHVSEQIVPLLATSSINLIQQRVMTLLPNCPVYQPTLQLNVYPPLSTICQEDTHMGSQLANGSATSPLSTCVWASVPDSYWAQSTSPLNEVLMSIESGHKLSSRVQRTISPLTPADTKERNIPVIIGRRRHSKRSCWQSRKNTSSNLIKINRQNTAIPDTATYTNVHDATGGRVLPTIYLLNPTSLATPHAIQQLTTDVLTYDADTVVMTESWLKQRHTNEAFTIPSFDILRRDRTRWCSGGVIVYVRSAIGACVCNSLLPTDDRIELLWIQLTSGYRRTLPPAETTVREGRTHLPAALPAQYYPCG